MTRRATIKFNRNRESSFIPQATVHSILNMAIMKESVKTNEAASNSIEWWQRPKRFERKELDASEIEQINSGGADNLFN